jgi:prepilin-type N-terminal cleavage/methylation domain-containing protein
MLSVRRRLALARATGPDAGITLVELMVTIVLMSIVSALALTWLLGESKTDTKTQNSTFTTSAARNVLDAWSALLRVADVPSNGYASIAASGAPAPAPTTVAPGASSVGRFLAIGTRSITFNADVANAPSSTCAGSCLRGGTTQVTLSLTAGGAMTQQLVQQGSATKSVTLVSSGAASTSSNGCLFSTFDVNGNALGCGPTTPLASIARVSLAFAVTPPLNGTAQSFQSSTVITGIFAPLVSASATATVGA